ncbi:MAG: hypothetical protein II275_06405 [Bacteroidaceae bacterium]|nr:hypothetical protein [Bacteroidaceae bacterium]
MINARKEEIRKALEAKGAEFRDSLDKTMDVLDKYQDAIENELNKVKFEKAQDEYIRNISKLAPQNERLSLEFSKLAGLALYHELPVDKKTLNLALNYVNRRPKK